jgi:hypothetical protein
LSNTGTLTGRVGVAAAYFAKMLGSANGAGSVRRERAYAQLTVLEDPLDQAPADYFTLGWLMSTQRSFCLVMLLLGLLATGEEKGRRS